MDQENEAKPRKRKLPTVSEIVEMSMKMTIEEVAELSQRLKQQVQIRMRRVNETISERHLDIPAGMAKVSDK